MMLNTKCASYMHSTVNQSMKEDIRRRMGGRRAGEHIIVHGFCPLSYRLIKSTSLLKLTCLPSVEDVMSEAGQSNAIINPSKYPCRERLQRKRKKKKKRVYRRVQVTAQTARANPSSWRHRPHLQVVGLGASDRIADWSGFVTGLRIGISRRSWVKSSLLH